MRLVFGVTVIAGLVALSPSFAQPPRPEGPSRGPDAARDASSFVSRLMSLDQNRDDQLAKSEVTDARLHSLFGRADSDGDDVVTNDELKSQFDEESKLLAQAGGRGKSGGGPGGGGGNGGGRPGGIGGGPGGPPGGGQGGGPGGRGQGGRGPGGQPGGPGQGGAGLQAAQNGLGGNMPPLGLQSRPCELMPQQLQAALNLTAEQRQQLDQIQQDVDARVAKVLNEQQLQQLRQMGVQAGAPDRGNRPPQNQGGQQPPPQRKQQQPKQQN